MLGDLRGSEGGGCCTVADRAELSASLREVRPHRSRSDASDGDTNVGFTVKERFGSDFCAWSLADAWMAA